LGDHQSKPDIHRIEDKRKSDVGISKKSAFLLNQVLPGIY